MKQLTSRVTYYQKKIFPAFWFGFLGLFVCVALVTGAVNSSLGFIFILVPASMAAIGYVIMKKLVFDLVDEVYDEGETLLFRDKGKEVRVSLADIKNVSYSWRMNPPRVTMSIRYMTELGDQISFSPPASFIPLRKNRDMDELIDRIDKARGSLRGT
jgi:hypothetical protein